MIRKNPAIRAIALAFALLGAGCGGPAGMETGEDAGYGDGGIDEPDVPPACGDGVLDDDELCDDGEANSDTEPDACRTDCSLPTCGDRVIDSGESCDSGDERSDEAPDACRLDCTVPECGDGVQDLGEPCDDGNDDDLDGCRRNCTLLTCGDGVLDVGEECDDGNVDDADGCQATCLFPVCGDGVLDVGEECDDANVLDGDGCQSDCTNSECLGDADCSDGLFCNGAESCVAGVCEAGTAATIDDGVACTVDSCNEATDSIDNRPDDGRCVPPLTALQCDGSRIVQPYGTCVPRVGCRFATRGVDLCIGTESSCDPAAPRVRHMASVCLGGGATDARCELVTERIEACVAPAAACFAGAGGPIFFPAAAPFCTMDAAGDARCGFTPATAVPCTLPEPTCATDRFTRLAIHTRYTSVTCTAARGCDAVSSVTVCARGQSCLPRLGCIFISG